MVAETPLPQFLHEARRQVGTRWLRRLWFWLRRRFLYCRIVYESLAHIAVKKVGQNKSVGRDIDRAAFSDSSRLVRQPPA